MTKEEEKYMYWLTSISGLGLSFIRKILERVESAQNAASWTEADVKKADWMRAHEKELFFHALKDDNWQREWERMEKDGVIFYSYFQDSYPSVLRHIDAPPKRLFVKGKLPDSKKISVAIVGARNCTPYGRDMARVFGYRLAKAGISVISGMALGIDGWSHQGALEGGGETYAVLGSGVMVCYPSCHRNLYESIQKHGGVISEFPIYARAKPNFFPMRNRIISGLSQGILVVEAREKSGSLITADSALEQGKDVFVIPGRIGDELSVGCNRLIRMGAIPVLSPNDILDYYGIAAEKEEGNVSEIQQRILNYMGSKMVHMDEIATGVKLTTTQVFKEMVALSQKGYVTETGRSFFMKKI